MKFLKKWLKRSKQPALAVDIGRQNTKFLLLDPSSGGKLKLLQALQSPTPQNAFENGLIKDEDNLADFLSRTVAQMNIAEEARVIAGFSGKTGLITKKIDIRNIEEEQVAEHLPFEIEQYLPYDMNDLDLDYEILSPSKAGSGGGTVSGGGTASGGGGTGGGNSKAIPVFVAAVLKKAVQEYDSLFAKAFLNCNIIDVNILAFCNAFEHCGGGGPGAKTGGGGGPGAKTGGGGGSGAQTSGGASPDVCLLLNIGDEHTDMAIMDGGEVIFTRSVAAGGAIYTEKISQALQTDMASAEDLKIQKEGRPEEALQAIQETHALVCNEVYNGYESFKTFFPHTKPSAVFATGGASQTEGLLSALERKFAVPAKPAAVFKNTDGLSEINMSENDLSVYFSVALGLGLRAL